MKVTIVNLHNQPGLKCTRSIAALLHMHLWIVLFFKYERQIIRDNRVNIEEDVSADHLLDGELEPHESEEREEDGGGRNGGAR